MTVATPTAERLISNATGVALDILFRSARDFSHLAAAPSSELVLARWSTLTAQAAIAVATKLTDPELIDRIATKEKRKTVRVALAGNRAAHEVTRLYYIQEGLRHHDYDILTAAIHALPLETLLDYCEHDESFRRNTNYSVVVADLMARADAELVRRYLDIIEPSSRNHVVQKMLAGDTGVALDLLEAIGYDLKTVELSRYNSFNLDDLNTFRRLLDVSGSHVYGAIIEKYASDPKVLASLNPKLLELIPAGTRIHLDVDNAKVFTDHNMIHVLARCNLRYPEDDAVEVVLAHTTDPVLRALFMTMHNNPALFNDEFADPAEFVRNAIASQSDTDIMQWLMSKATSLGMTTTVALLEALLASAPDVRIGNQVRTLSGEFGISVDALLEMLPDQVFEKIASLPQVRNHRRLLERGSTVGNKGRMALIILDGQDDVEPAVAYECVDMLIALGQHTQVQDWLSGQPAELVEPVIARHRDVIAGYLSERPSLHRSPWVSEMVDVIRAPRGWAAHRSSGLIESAFRYLDEAIGQDAKIWETSLTLFDEWTGTLDELVAAARSL